AEGGEVEPALGGEVAEPQPAPAPRAGPELEGEQQHPRQRQQDPEHHVGAAAPELAHELHPKRQRPARRVTGGALGHAHHRSPISSRKTPSSRGPAPAAPAGPPRLSSSRTGPAETSRPRCITTTWLQVCSTSASRWLEMITVRPRSA